jgi:hypothetical protein
VYTTYANALQIFQFPKEELFWEPEEHLKAAELVRKFWRDLGRSRDEFTEDCDPVEVSDDFICTFHSILNYFTLTNVI